MTSEQRRRLGSVLWGVALLAAGACDFWVALRPEPAPIPGGVMARAADQIRALSQPGDLVVHSPLFSVSELVWLGDLPARPDLPSREVRDQRRVVLLDRRDAPMAGFGEPAEVHEVAGAEGRIAIAVFEPTGPRVVSSYALIDQIGPETLRIERPHSKVNCTAPRAEGGFSCPSEAEWLYAAPRRIVIGGREAPCVWAHPTTGGVVVFTLPAPTGAAAHRWVLAMEAALADDAVRTTADGAAVETEVFQDGKSRGGLVVTNTIGWVRREFDVEPGVPVELRITTPHDGRRHHCLNAVLREIDTRERRGKR